MAPRVNYAVYPQFLLRVTGLPVEALDQIPYGESLARSFIEREWKDDVIKAAVGLASNGLFSAIENSISEDQDPDKNIRTSFLNYYTRFCTRATPFGLFSGVVLGEISSNLPTEISLEPMRKSVLHVRLDTEYLVALTHHLIRIREVRDRLTYKPSSSLYKVGHQYRFIESFYNQDAKKRYSLSAIEEDLVLHLVLEFCYEGRGINDFISFLVKQGYGKDEALVYIDELIDSQIIVSNLEVVLTGVEYQTFLYQQLEPLRKVHPLVEQILSIINYLKPGFTPEGLLKVHPRLIEMAGDTKVPVRKAKLLQGDLHRLAKKCQLSRSITNQILMGIRILKAFSRQDESDSLVDFKALFRRRFGDSEVQLTMVMDQESGIGLFGTHAQQMADPAPLLDDLAKYGRPGRASRNSPIHRDMIFSSVDAESRPLYHDLEKEDIKLLDIHNGDSWPFQVYAMFSLLGSGEHPDIYLPYAVPGHSAHLLGRFGFLPGSGIREFISSCVNDEINSLPDVVMAEIQHLPEDRTGNILQRPDFYEYDIPFMAQSVKALDKQLAIEDIMVSVVKDEVILRSKRLNRKILPRLSNAHNYSSGNLALYEFLVKVGRQGQGMAYQLPSQESSGRVFTPGVRYGNIHFRLPEWRLQVDYLRQQVQTRKAETGFQALQFWVKANHLPQKVLLMEGDRDYFIDWENPLFLRMVWERIRERDLVRFQIFPFTGGSPIRHKQYS
ncbi:MAG: lantibiotic dehydratase family protein, partial [Bacteroidales bacterium]|nr:lantibiotic dehydratase family protein [Bacteroidales bacterium]